MFVCIAHACCQPTPPLPHSLSLPFAASSHVFWLHTSCSKYCRCLCNSVSLNVRVWDAASSGTKCNAIQMRPNVAKRFSDFATNSRAMTSMSMLYSLSLCTCRTARWLSRCWLLELRKYVFRRRSDETLHSTKKFRGPIHCWSPQPKSCGGLVSPTPWLLRLWLIHSISLLLQPVVTADCMTKQCTAIYNT